MSLALGGARGEGWSLSFLFELMRVDEDCREGGREGRKIGSSVTENGISGLAAEGGTCE